MFLILVKKIKYTFELFTPSLVCFRQTFIIMLSAQIHSNIFYKTCKLLMKSKGFKVKYELYKL